MGRIGIHEPWNPDYLAPAIFDSDASPEVNGFEGNEQIDLLVVLLCWTGQC